MNSGRPLRSSMKVWLAISVSLFIAFWFLRSGKGGDTPLWEMWHAFITHDYECSTREMLTGLGIYSLVLAIPAALFGWVLQFPICRVWDYFHRSKSRDNARTA
jgi:ABC-type Fe3+ transport system permease subunit